MRIRPDTLTMQEIYFPFYVRWLDPNPGIYRYITDSSAFKAINFHFFSFDFEIKKNIENLCHQIDKNNYKNRMIEYR